MSSGNIFQSKSGKKVDLKANFGWKTWLGFGVVILVALGFTFGQYNKVLHDTTPVSASQVQTMVDDHKQVVFYRDNCSACQKAMPMLVARNVIKQDTLFVNMNVKSNERLKKTFNLKSVPTLLNKNGDLSHASAWSMVEHMEEQTSSGEPQLGQDMK